MEKKKRTFYKLGPNASIFSDHQTGLKVTKNVPGSTTKPESKVTATARSNGHIIEIPEEAANEMFDALSPEERKAAYDEQGITAEDAAAEAASSTPDPEDKEREALLEQLKKIKLTRTRRDEVMALPTPELKAFIEAETKK